MSESFLPDLVSPMLSQSWSVPGYTPPATVNLGLGMGSELVVELMICSHSGSVAVRSKTQVSLKHLVESQPKKNKNNTDHVTSPCTS